jgi:hypothetical protein
MPKNHFAYQDPSRVVPLGFLMIFRHSFFFFARNGGGSAVGEFASTPHFTPLNFSEGESI